MDDLVTAGVLVVSECIYVPTKKKMVPLGRRAEGGKRYGHTFPKRTFKKPTPVPFSSGFAWLSMVLPKGWGKNKRD